MNPAPDYELPRQTNFEAALALARARLSELDFGRQCGRAGLPAGTAGAPVKLLDRDFFLTRTTLELEVRDSGPAPAPWERIIVLHYLATAGGAPDTGALITYQQVQDGASYYPVFLRRTAAILLASFPPDLAGLAQAAAAVGAVPAPGPAAVNLRLPALPRVAYLLAAYPADDEFPADLKILFDSSITSYLPAEDITVLAQMACLKIVRAKR